MFVKININPKSIKASDCVIRAISLASGIDYSDVYWGLCNIGADMCRIPNEKKVYEKYLEDIGFVKQKMPKNDDNTRYKVNQLATELNDIYEGFAVVSVANHLTCVGHGNIYDTWDCGYKSVGNFWLLPDNIIS